MNDKLVKEIEKKFGVVSHFKSDKEMYSYYKKIGVPSLSKLLKLVTKIV